MRKDAFDGESGEIIHFDVHKGPLYRQQPWPIRSKAWTDVMTSLVTQVFQPFCISTLERWLQLRKGIALRRGKSYGVHTFVTLVRELLILLIELFNK